MIGITKTFTRAVLVDSVSFSAFAGSGQDDDNMTRHSTQMPVVSEEMPIMMQGYMKKIEARIGDIEVLLQQLLELQKSNSNLTNLRQAD